MGQGARSGGGKGAYFEGGQLPLARRLPFKRGFTNIRRVEYKTVNLDRLAEFDFGGETVDPEIMAAIGLIKKPTDRVVILGEGEVAGPINVQAHRFSAAAKEKIEAAGGKAEVIPFNA
jgi:large subunit ribosomal protein L15